MKLRSQAFLMGTAIALTSCAPKATKTVQKIGPKNSNAKFGYILEDTASALLADSETLNWHHYDLKEEDLYGVSSEKAYNELDLKQTKEIIVAVIDSGVDIYHEDLQGKIWINSDEIPGNGIDDDNNGYIDDVHGWNYIGGQDGSHVNDENLEVTRTFKRLSDKLASGNILTRSEEAIFSEVKKEVESNLEKWGKLFTVATADKVIRDQALKVIKAELGIDIKSKSDLLLINSKKSVVIKAKKSLFGLFDKYYRGISGIDGTIERANMMANVYYNVDFDARARIVGDDPSDFTDIHYGNNDVKGPDSLHGTHVAGTIASIRDNNLGGFGVAKNVKIMAIRAVPNGDERDKDIALAVRYAVDNGAHIINMSFGKSYSPYKEHVDAAFLYAASKGVLMVHAAGNSAKNVDGGINNFPNSYRKSGNGILKVFSIPNWIEVGASTKDNGMSLPASFSNYGNEAVTLFSPGHKIYSTFPENEYQAISGTSMAAPVAAGVAAMLMSEYPELKGGATRNILMTSVSLPKTLVRLPSETGGSTIVPFADLSVTDGVVNAYNALIFAQEYFKR